MSDDFATMNVRSRGDRAREIERIRQHYRENRDTLMRLASEAPSEYLANEYHRLVREIDSALAKLDEIEGRAAATTVPPAVQPPAAQASRPHGDPLRAAASETGSRPLIPTAAATEPAGASDAQYETSPGSRIALIVVAGIIVLGLIAGLIWRASSERKAQTPVAEQPMTTAAPETAPTTVEPVTPAPRAVSPLVISPALADYGILHKGTRATRQFEITNTTSESIPIAVARSKCHCLFYEYASRVAPGKKETITVTIDGARAQAGTLRETIAVRSKKDPSISTSFEVAATVR